MENEKTQKSSSLFLQKLAKKFKNWIRMRSVSERIVFVIVWLLFAVLALSYLSIFIWTFLASLKTHEEVVMYPFRLPAQWQFYNFIEVFELLESNGVNYFGMLFNSLYWSVVCSFVNIMCTICLAYVCCKIKFKGAKFYYYISLLVTMLPIYGTGGAQYKLYVNLHLINSYSEIIAHTGGIGMSFLYFYAMYESMSGTYAEAAEIDGANDWQIFFKIIFPQSMNLFGVLFLLAWKTAWNNYSAGLIYLRELPTLAVGIYSFELEMARHVRKDILYAAYFLASLPPIIIFSLFNNALTSNISLGGIKE